MWLTMFAEIAERWFWMPCSEMDVLSMFVDWPESERRTFSVARSEFAYTVHYHY